jgi:hypothetical protein
MVDALDEVWTRIAVRWRRLTEDDWKRPTEVLAGACRTT